MNTDTKPIEVAFLEHEVVQSLQNQQGDIDLIPGKPTVIRFYLLPTSLESETGKVTSIKGELEIYKGYQGTYKKLIKTIPSIGYLELNRGINKSIKDLRQDLKALRQELEPLRQDLRFSLNFGLTDTDLFEQLFQEDDDIELRLKLLPQLNPYRVFLFDDGKESMPLEKFKKYRRRCINKCKFRVHTIGLRYRSLEDDTFYIPSRVNFEYLRSFLKRAFPISELEWNETVIDADTLFEPPFRFSDSESVQREWKKKINATHMQLMAVRARNIEANTKDANTIDANLLTDMRLTHYYGMVFDPEYNFDGEASDVPNRPCPETVAVGQAESYSGYYGAHELAHCLGRLHPGYPVDQQDEEDDSDKIPEKGLISRDEDGHVGFDYGDAVNDMQILQREEWHDIMTYEDNLWISSYTYRGLLERIVEENKQEITPADRIQIIGEYDLQNDNGGLRYVFPVQNNLDDQNVPDTEKIADSKEDKTYIKAYYAESGKPIDPEHSEEFKIKLVDRESKSNALFRSYSTFQLTIPMKDDNSKVLGKLELYINGKQVDNREFKNQGQITKPELSDPKLRLNCSAIDADTCEYFLTINLKKSVPGTESDSNSETTYTVQVRPLDYIFVEKPTRQSRIWHTIAVDVKEPKSIYLDKQLLLLDKSLIETTPSFSKFDHSTEHWGDKPNGQLKGLNTPRPQLLGFELRVLAKSGIDEIHYKEFDGKMYIERVNADKDTKRLSNLVEIETTKFHFWHNKLQNLVIKYNDAVNGHERMDP